MSDKLVIDIALIADNPLVVTFEKSTLTEPKSIAVEGVTESVLIGTIRTLLCSLIDVMAIGEGVTTELLAIDVMGTLLRSMGQ